MKVHPNATHHVYRYFNESGDLLYVGCSMDLQTRERHHAVASEWFSMVTRRTEVAYPDFASARQAEKDAIRAEMPRHNRMFYRSTAWGDPPDGGGLSARLARAIWMLMEARELTPSELAANSKIPEVKLRRILSGTGVLKTDEISRLADALGISPIDVWKRAERAA